MLKDAWVFDLETYPNIFTCCAVYSNGKHMRVYEISDRKNESEELMEWLRNLVRHKHKMVGFNNLGFDYPVIHYMIEKARKYKSSGKQCKFTPLELYTQAQKLIKSQDNEFGNTIRASDIIIPQIDLYKIHHFDNKAKATSLKMLEFNMRSQNIEDLPYAVGTKLNDEEKDVLIEYNKHDVLQTLEFMKHSMKAINLRQELTVQYGFDCTNFNDTKIGTELFIQTLEKESPGSCYTKNGQHRKMRQTKRDKIVIKDCLFSYISFDRPEFEAVYNWFSNQVISETKGIFSDLFEHELGDVAKYAEMVTKRKKIGNKDDCQNYGFEWDIKRKRCLEFYPTEQHILDLKQEQPLGWIEEKELKSPKGAKSYYWCYNVAETLNVVINGFRYDYGTGGIHGAKQGIIEAKDTMRIRTLDVKSYYPNMAIANNVYPNHLGETFCKVYKDLYQQRAASPKKSAANAALKLALNGVYGNSNNEYSPLYDPAYTMSITIGGQLSLCMLMEKLINHCNAEIIMCNTDGFECVLDETMTEEADKWVTWWEGITGLEMEGGWYKAMYIRDVNSYIAIKED